jgi:hypothetical protein
VKDDNYLKRHWCGELSLAQSFWVNYILLNLAFNLLPHPDFYKPTWTPSARLLYYGMRVVVYIWQLVGCWRTASREESGYGWAAMIVMAINTILGIVGILLLVAKSTGEGIDQ